MKLAEFEVADIFRDFGLEYMNKSGNSFPLQHHKVMTSIKNCRTALLGGHKEECDQCREIRYSYNSCRNRHCPKCQFLTREKWVENRTSDLLPLKYFHVVFTLPDLLRPVVLRNQKVLYDMLFRSVNETLKVLCKDEKYLGAEIGFICVLHTWSQTLLDHPHIHVIVPGGGLSNDGQSWKSFRDNFFLPVKVMSRMFRGKFLHYFKECCFSKELKFPGQISMLENENEFSRFLRELYKREWVVYSKDAFQGAEGVVKYLGRYTHRVAISNYRIKSITDGNVKFSWRDSRDNNRRKIMELSAVEFIRRFLLHVLPHGYMRIRHYGFLSNKNCREKLEKIRALLRCSSSREKSPKESWQEKLFRLTGFDVTLCPFCGKGRMQVVETFEKRIPGIRSP